MLHELYIQNLAIIKSQQIVFGPGFNVITGESGSGKSILMHSVDLLLGARASKSIIGKHGDEALVEGLFTGLGTDTLKRLSEMGIVTEDDTIVVTRQFSKKGPSVCRINRQMLPLTSLREITSDLIDIHGQNDQYQLMDKKKYLKIVDNYSDATLSQLKWDLSTHLKSIADLEVSLASFDLDDGQIDREKDMLSFQLEEIRQIDFTTLDESTLEAEYHRLNNITELQQLVGKTTARLDNEDYRSESALSLLRQGVIELEDAAHIDPQLEEFVERTKGALFEIEDIHQELRRYEERLEPDEEKIYALNRTLETLTALRRKYGPSTEDVVAYAEKQALRLKDLESIEKIRIQIGDDLKKHQKSATAICNKMTDIRKRAAKILESRIVEELLELDMKEVRFRIDFKEGPIGPNGSDDLDFMISTNKGEELKSMSQVASGGELSRIMLAFKSVTADLDETPSILFDEIDQGISGHAAEIVAKKLYRISKNHQVIAVSHLPQLAIYADIHFYTSKRIEGQSTLSQIRILDDAGKIEEVARLIGGSSNRETTLLTAKTMLETVTPHKNIRR